MSLADPSKDLQAAIVAAVKYRLMARLQEQLERGGANCQHDQSKLLPAALGDVAALLRGIADQLEAKR